MITRCAGFMVAVLLLGVTGGQGAPIFIEAETAGVATTNARAPGWRTRELPGAVGGKILASSGHAYQPGYDSALPLFVTIPAPGAYRVWVRYFRATVKDKVQAVSFAVLLRDEAGEELAYHAFDRVPRMPSEKPYEPNRSWAGDRAGFVWEPFEASFERSVKAEMLFSGGPGAQVDCLIVARSPDFDPNGLDEAALASLASSPAPALAIPPAPPGLAWSRGSPAHADDYAGVSDPDQRFQAGLINNGSGFIDSARLIRMGFNRDHAQPTPDSVRHGIRTQSHVEAYHGGDDLRQYGSPTGRFINAAGQVGAGFSFHFPPVTESADRALEANVKAILDSPQADAYACWRISVEDGGNLDYSPGSQAAFRKWLEAKHGAIGRLNESWGTTHAAFDEIVPPAAFSNGPSAWLEFRDFCGKTYTTAVARQLPLIRKLDPKKRSCVGATSNLDLFAPYFSRFRPIDWDEFVTVALAGERFVSWDTYCADDQFGAEVDLVTAVAEGRRPVVQEWSNHVNEPRIAARSYWTAVSKGVAGIFLFMLQDGGGHASYPKWALLSQDRSPKAKLAAYSDAVQEVHRLEPLLMAARPVHAVKPVALYWSRIDLSLAQPDGSLYGTAVNSPIHVYRTLRGLGYPVRWITPRQIEAGALDQAAALVLAGCDHIPRNTARRIEGWVKSGGIVIGDQWPGAWDEYARPQSILAPVFGVAQADPKPRDAKAGMLAVEESTQGYGEVTDAAVVRKEYFTMVEEVAQQPSATHPVSRALGDYMVSGIGPAKIKCVAGHVVGMTHRGTVGFVVNTFGKGHALYSALMLGTIYESGGTRFEWDTTHAGLGYGRILDAFLKFAGVRPGAVTSGLAPRVAAKLRVESPLVTPEGNVLVGLTSLNDNAVGPFDLAVELPASAGGPFARVFVATEGSRRLQPVEGVRKGTRMLVRMPRFDTHATIVAARNAGPLVSLDLKGVTRGEAGLALIGTNQSFEIEAVVYNLSPRTLPAGELALSVPAGWLQSAESLPVGTIAAGAEARVVFTVRAPALAAARRIHPILARYASGDLRSTPATEMVWWE